MIEELLGGLSHLAPKISTFSSEKSGQWTSYLAAGAERTDSRGAQLLQGSHPSAVHLQNLIISNWESPFIFAGRPSVFPR